MHMLGGSNFQEQYDTDAEFKLQGKFIFKASAFAVLCSYL